MVATLIQHGIQRAGLLANCRHLDQHRRKQPCLLHGQLHLVARCDIIADFEHGFFVNNIARCARHRFQRIH